VRLLVEIEVTERLLISVADDEALGQLLNEPRRRETTRWHGPSEMKLYGRQGGRTYKLDYRMPKCIYNILQLGRGHRAFSRTEMAQPMLNIV
jgi:hypothetical protein